MSARLLSYRAAQRAIPHASRTIARYSSLTAGGLTRPHAQQTLARPRAWPPGSYAIHNVVAVRHISSSFVRVIPQFFVRLIRLPAILAGGVFGGLAYVQYQAQQAGTYAIDVFNQAKDSVTVTTSSWLNGAKGIIDQTKRGLEQESGKIQMPAWMENIVYAKDSTGGSGGGSGGGRGPHDQEEKQSSISGGSVAAGGGATAAAFAMGDSDEETDRRSAARAAKDDQMMLLTKKMIEIRSLLNTVGQSDALILPSIVVIGSQSSGKSSVLEAIVGHEFLPKGSNMVTRRPIELTLVNTPEAKAEYGEFPALGLGKITDFTHIQKTLTDLNLAVPEQDCVSDDPIQLRIYSPKVPDLSMIDLPGYIQVAGHDQPTELKQKIADLCERYIKAPNIILAVSAADVDLANSTSLRASRKIDPRGERTIGVITKMDLVDPARGAAILNDRNYPLRLGYVGVVSKIPTASSLFNRGSVNITNAIVKNENSYFSAHPSEFGQDTPVTVGTTNLRQKLMHVLEQSMAASLSGTSEAIQQELAEASYEFKVQYNDRPLSAESYLAESLDAFKHSFKGFSDAFGRQQLQQLLKHELDQQVLNLLAQRYWNKPLEDLIQSVPETVGLAELPKADPETAIWKMKLDSSSSALTKLGIGRLATGVVASTLQTHINELIAASVFSSHPFARQTIIEASTSILKDLSYDTSDELEICLKPYKYRIEVDDSDWKKGRENMGKVLKDELSTCDTAYKQIEQQVGGSRRLKDVVAFIDRVRKGDIVLEGNGSSGAGGFSADLLRRGREAVFLRDRSEIIRMRMAAVKSKQCANKSNKYSCPEVFLDAVADKLTSTADLFLDAEMLSKYYYLFPRELDARLGRGLSLADMERFAREDPKIRRHLDLVNRKETLEHVLREMESLRHLENRERRGSSQKQGNNRKWSLF